MGDVRPAWRIIDGITGLAWMLAWPGTSLHLHVNGEPRKVRLNQFGRLVTRLELEQGPHMELELSGGRYGAFWCMVSGSEQNAFLARFRPHPTLVMREGSSSRRTAVWALHGRPDLLSYEQIVKGNKRIAHALRAPKKNADPDRARFVVPGTALREDRSRPVPIVVEHLSVEEFRPRQVVGSLKDPPVPTWNQ